MWHKPRLDLILMMIPQAVATSSYGNSQNILHLRAKDVFVESEIHSTIDCLRFFSKVEEQDTQEPNNQPQSNAISSVAVNNVTVLSSLLESASTPGDFNIFFISQTTSWSRLKISLEMFDRLIQFFEVFEEFSSYILMFGKRIRDSLETSVTSRMRLHTDNGSLLGYEICYNIRHFELHGRELKDSWSCRHAAFYQHYSFTKHSSTWIVIQGPSKLKSSVESILSVENRSAHVHPLYLHVHFFKTLERNWASYLITLEEQRRMTSDKFSFLGSCKISVELLNIHDIHLIQAKIRTAISIIEGTMDVISTVIDLHNLIQNDANQACQSPLASGFSGLLAELKQLLSVFQSHLRTASKILHSSEDTKVMLLAIINQRHNDVIRMHASSIDTLSAVASNDSQLRTKIAREALAESSIVRIATLITVFYLPLNLTTAFFSTDLIVFRGIASIELRKCVWVFVVMTGVLLGCTVMAVWGWKRLEKIGKKKIVP